MAEHGVADGYVHMQIKSERGGVDKFMRAWFTLDVGNACLRYAAKPGLPRADSAELRIERLTSIMHGFDDPDLLPDHPVQEVGGVCRFSAPAR